MSTILVTGATGKQGGAVARGLMEHGHTVRAFTRNADGAAAKALAGAGAQIVVGALEDRGSLDRAASGADAVFSMGTPFEQGPGAEVQQGINVADAAKAAGAYLVYTSVGSADRATGIPHFDSKYRVEQHIRSIGARAAIIAPVYFMENAYFAADQLKAGVYATPLAQGRKLAQIAVDDIAACAIAALEDPATFAGTRHDLAGDEVSGDDAVAVLSRVSGRPFGYFQVPMAMIRQRMGEDGALMYEWFESTGYSVDRAALARAFPTVKWTTFEAWAKRQPILGG
jgi:uncharacterized protein YbjT (DUF2867 family)